MLSREDGRRLSRPSNLPSGAPIPKRYCFRRQGPSLLHEAVPGISVTKVKGYGEYESSFRHDGVAEYARIESILQRKRADEMARVIVEAA